MSADDHDDFCSECHTDAPSHVELRTETYEPWGRRVVLPDTPVRICDVCGSERIDMTLDEATFVRAYLLAGLQECPNCGRWGPPEQWSGMNGRCPRCSEYQDEALRRMTQLAEESGGYD